MAEWFHVKISHEVTVRAKNSEEAEKLAVEGMKSDPPDFYIEVTKATKDQIRPYE